MSVGRVARPLTQPVVLKAAGGAALYAFGGSELARVAGLALAGWGLWEYLTQPAAPALTLVPMPPADAPSAPPPDEWANLPIVTPETYPAPRWFQTGAVGQYVNVAPSSDPRNLTHGSIMYVPPFTRVEWTPGGYPHLMPLEVRL